MRVCVHVCAMPETSRLSYVTEFAFSFILNWAYLNKFQALGIFI